MKNRRNIIESELPPQNPLDIWMKDGKFYRSTKKGWTLIEDQMEFTDSKLMSKSTATSGTIGVNKDTGEASIYNDVAKKWSPLGGGLTEITWQELKDKRDNGQLIPGSLYRITDYQCTTTQENTQSAGHQFDIVLLALSEDKLAEEGWAMEHPTDVYDVTFATGETIKCYISQTYYVGDSLKMNLVRYDTHKGRQIAPTDIVAIDNVLKTATVTLPLFLLSVDVPYNYFQNSNLSAWKVWYCLDNDTDRFAWAQEKQITFYMPPGIPGQSEQGPYVRTYKDDDIENNEYGWGIVNQSTVVTIFYSYGLDITTNYTFHTHKGDPQPPQGQGPVPSRVIIEEGKGVIYRLIDEWNNDVPYDFKNIQFIRKLTGGVLDTSTGTNTYVYTFNLWHQDECVDGTVVGNTIIGDEDIVVGVKNNYFGSVDVSAAIGSQKGNINCPCLGLGNNAILSTCEGDWFYGASGNIITDNSRGCTLSGEENNVDNREIYAGVGCFLDAGASDAVARHCMGTTITVENVIAIKCDFDTITEQGIYFMSKKVLTET